MLLSKKKSHKLLLRATLVVAVVLVWEPLHQLNLFAAAASTGTVKASLNGLWDILRRRKHTGTTANYQGLTVIGAGFGRTGTKSIEEALHQIGHKQIYDVTSMLEHNHVYRWRDAAKEWRYNNNLTSIAALLEEMEGLGYTATLDTPMNLFALAFAELRPKAKVLFSVRDNEEKWLASVKVITRSFLGRMFVRPWKWMASDLIDGIDFLTLLWDGPSERPVYPDHISRPLPWYEYCHTIPTTLPKYDDYFIQLHRSFQKELEESLAQPEQLLMFNVKQGWAPLVKFLELPEEISSDLINEPFPFVNDKGTIQVLCMIMDVIAIGLPFWIILLLGLTWKVGSWTMSVLHTIMGTLMTMMMQDGNNKGKNKVE